MTIQFIIDIIKQLSTISQPPRGAGRLGFAGGLTDLKKIGLNLLQQNSYK